MNIIERHTYHSNLIKLLSSKNIKNITNNLSYCDTSSGTGVLIQVNGKTYIADSALTELLTVNMEKI